MLSSSQHQGLVPQVPLGLAHRYCSSRTASHFDLWGSSSTMHYISFRLLWGMNCSIDNYKPNTERPARRPEQTGGSRGDSCLGISAIQRVLSMGGSKPALWLRPLPCPGVCTFPAPPPQGLGSCMAAPGAQWQDAPALAGIWISKRQVRGC